MRASGTIGILVYCADCSHSIEMSAEQLLLLLGAVRRS
jgi:hypothetical protein